MWWNECVSMRFTTPCIRGGGFDVYFLYSLFSPLNSFSCKPRLIEVLTQFLNRAANWRTYCTLKLNLIRFQFSLFKSRNYDEKFIS